MLKAKNTVQLPKEIPKIRISILDFASPTIPSRATSSQFLFLFYFISPTQNPCPCPTCSIPVTRIVLCNCSLCRLALSLSPSPSPSVRPTNKRQTTNQPTTQTLSIHTFCVVALALVTRPAIYRRATIDAPPTTEEHARGTAAPSADPIQC